MTNWISTADHGDGGTPGTCYYKIFAGIKRTKNGQYELHVRDVSGSNQGHLEEHERVERRYRADNLAELLQLGLSEIQADSHFGGDSRFSAAIRDAVYAAQDAESEGQEQ